MKKLFFLFIFVFFIVSVNAAVTDNNNPYYSFNNADITGSNPDDLSGNGNDGSSTDVLTGKAGILAESFLFSKGTNARVDISSPAIAQANTDSWTINLWYYTNTSITNDPTFQCQDGTNDIIGTTNTPSLYMRDTIGTTKIISSDWHDENNWTMITLRYNYSNSLFEAFKNGAQIGSLSSVSGTDTITRCTIGNDKNLGDNFPGYVDEFSQWTRAIGDDELIILYGGGTGYDPYATPPLPTGTLNLSDTLPADESGLDTLDVNFNLTANATYEFNCSLYLNSTLNSSKTGFGPGNNILVDFDYNFGESGFYEYFISCEDNTTQVNTTNKTFILDSIPPVITTNFLNFSSYYLNNLSGQFNFSDNLVLHSMNITIDNITIDNITHIHESSYMYNLSYNVTSLSTGEHVLGVEISDGHTSEKLLDPEAYNPKNGLFNNYMRYEFEYPYSESYLEIKGIEESLFDTFTTYYNGLDRYKIKYKPNKKNSSYVFTVKSDKKIDIVSIGNNKYGGDWIIVDGHWVDFFIPGQDNMNVLVKRVNDKLVEVEVTGVDPLLDELEFNSVGDINVVKNNYFFYKTNTTTSFEDVTFELDDQIISFYINKTNYVSTEADLYYDGVAQTVTKTSFADYDRYVSTFQTPTISNSSENITFFWDYNITSAISESGIVSYNQTVYQIRIDNCSTYTTRAINLSLRNQSDNSLVNGSIYGHFEIYISESGSYRPFNLSFTGGSQYGVCIDPPYANYYTNSQFEYSSPSFSNTKNYYFLNNNLTNNTDVIDFYFSSSESQITINVVDQNSDPLEDAYVYILKYDIATNSYITSEIVKTGSDGVAIGNVVLGSERYKFRVNYDDEFVLDTSDRILLTDSITLYVNLETDYFDNYNVVQGVTCGISYENSTQTFTFDYSDPSSSITQACLNVGLETGTSSISIDQTCSTNSIDSLQVTVTGNLSTIGAYVSTGNIVLDGTTFICSANTQTFNQDYKIYGVQGVFFAFLFVLTMAMVGVWSPTASALLTIFALIISNIFGILHLGYASMIVMVILGGIVVYKSTNQ